MHAEYKHPLSLPDCNSIPQFAELFNGGPHKLSVGTTLYNEGFPATTLFFVNDGEVHLTTNSEFMSHVIVDFAKQGDVVGAETMLPNNEYRSTAEVYHETTVSAISNHVLQKMATCAPNLFFETHLRAMESIQRSSDYFKTLAMLPLDQRIRLAIRDFTDQETLRCDVPMRFIAMRANTSRVSVQHALTKFLKEGNIALDPDRSMGKLVFPDSEALKTFV